MDIETVVSASITSLTTTTTTTITTDDQHICDTKITN